MKKNEAKEILEVVNFIKDYVAEMAGNMFTKEEGGDLSRRITSLEKGQEEILKELKPLSRAHDKDAVTILSHEKRITRIEKQVAAR